MKTVIFVCLVAFLSGSEGRRIKMESVGRTYVQMYTQIIYAQRAFQLKREQARRKIDACLETFVNSKITASMDHVCEEIRTTNECLRRAADDFYGQDKLEELGNWLKRLQDHYTETCSQNGEKQSFREKTEICMDKWTPSLESSSIEDLCEDLRNATDCIRRAAVDTFGKDETVEGNMKRLEEFYYKNCQEKVSKAENFRVQANICNKYMGPSIIEKSNSVEEMCRNMKKGIDCFKNAAYENFGKNEKVQEDLKKLPQINFYDSFCKETEILQAEKECREDRGESCKSQLSSMLFQLQGNEGATDFTEYLCKSLKTTSDCFESAIDNCFGDKKNDEIRRDLERLKQTMKGSKCEDSGGEDNDDDNAAKSARCIEENKEKAVFECLNEELPRLLDLARKNSVDRNIVICTLYNATSACFVHKIRKPCGNKAVEIAKEDLKTTPSEIVAACAAARQYNVQTTTTDLPMHNHEHEEEKK